MDILCNSVSATITNGMASVAVNGLECGAPYTIIAGGTHNGDLVGPRSSHEFNTIVAVIYPSPVGTYVGWINFICIPT